MNDAQLERDLHAVLAVDVDEARYARALERTLRLVDDEIAATRTRSGRAPRVGSLPRLTPRALLIMALVLVLLVAVAVAQPQVRRVIFGEPERPANRVEAFQAPEPSVQLSSLERPSEDPIEFGLATSLDAMTQQSATEPGGWGEPLPAYARLLLDQELGGVRVRIAAAPTDAGNVCYVRNVGPVTGGTCFERLDGARPAAFDTVAEGGRVAIAGVMVDEVQSVAIERSDGSRMDAFMSTNAFAWVGTERPHAVTFTMSDGAGVRMTPSGAVA